MEDLVPRSTPEPPFGADANDRDRTGQSAFKQAAEEFARANGLNPLDFGGEKLGNHGLTPEELQKKKEQRNFFNKTIWGGRGEWGVIELPGGTPFINPLKTFVNIIANWIPKNIGDPIAGTVVGASISPVGQFGRVRAPWHSKAAIESADARRVAMYNQFKTTLKGSSNPISLWKNLGEFQREREAFFIGDKFVSSIISDPSSYFGLGLASKVPLVGKTALTVKGTVASNRVTRAIRVADKAVDVPVGLGAIEDGYIKAVELPFRFLAKGYRAIPKSRRQTTVEVGANHEHIMSMAISERAGGAVQDAPRAIYQKLMNDVINIANVPDSALTEKALNLRKALFTFAPPDKASVKSLNKLVGGSVEEFNASELETVTELFRLHARGIASKDEIAEQLVSLFGGTKVDSVDLMGSRLEDITERALNYMKKGYLNTSAQGGVARIRSIAKNTHELALESRPFNLPANVVDAMNNKAITAGLMNSMDIANRKILQQWIAPGIGILAKSVLMFPSFIVQNGGEESIRMILGREVPGMLDDLTTSRLLAGWDDIPAGLTNELGVSKAVVTRTDGMNTKINISDSFLQAIHLGGMHPKMEAIASKTIGKLNPNKWLEANARLGRGMRRKYFTERAYKEMVTDIAVHDPELLAQIDTTLQGIDRGLSEGLKKAIVLRAGQGGDAVRQLTQEFGAETLKKQEITDVVMKYVANNDFRIETRERLLEWANNSHRTFAEIRPLMKDIAAQEEEYFIVSPDGMREAFKLGIETLAKVPDNDPQGLYQVMNTVNGILDEFANRIEDIMQETASGMSVRKVTSAEKQKRWAQAESDIIDVLETMEGQRKELVKTIKSKEVSVFKTNEGFADVVDKKLDLIFETWVLDREQVADHFANKWDDITFWDKLSEIRSGIWDQYRVDRSLLDESANGVQAQLLSKYTDIKVPKFKAKDFRKRSELSVNDAAYIMGGNSENVSQALLKGAFMSEARFVDHMIARAERYKHTGVTPAKARRLYRKVMNNLGMSQRLHAGYQAVKGKRLFELEQDLKGLVKTNSHGKKEFAKINKFISDTADFLDEKGFTTKKGVRVETAYRKDLRERGQKVISNTHEKLKRWFVNYEDQNIIDDAMQNIFPFWVYESRRLGFLAQTGLTHPLVWNSTMPGGRYYESTSEGYVNGFGIPWTEVNPFGGTIFNAPKRMARATYPQQEREGMIGAYSGVERQLERFGFYPGPHIGIATDVIHPVLTGDKARVGEVLPPPVNTVLSLLEMSELPGIGHAAKKMRQTMFHDRFRTYSVSKILVERGFNPRDVDWKTFTPKASAIDLEQSDLDEASSLSARLEFVQEAIGMVRFRGPAEQEYRQARDQIIKDYTGATQKELDQYRFDGISITEVYALPIQVRRELSELNNADGFAASKAALYTGERKELIDLTANFWRSVDTQRQVLIDSMDDTQEKWQEATMARSDILPTMARHETALRNIKDGLRGRRYNVETGEVEVVDANAPYFKVPLTTEEYLEVQAELGNDVLPLRHPFDEMLDAYYSIVPLDKDGDGQIEWNDWHEAREDFKTNSVPDEMRSAFITETTRSATPLQATLQNLQNGILGEYWSAERDMATERDMEKMYIDIKRAEKFDPERAKFWKRNNTDWKDLQKATQLKKTFMRQTEPVLDYALWAFGLSNTMLSREANTWRVEDKSKPVLSRMFAP